MIPVEIQESSLRFQNFVAEDSNEERRLNLDLLDEVREEARVKAEAVKRRIERRYNSKVMPRQFREGDLVMRKAHQYEMENKLSPKWMIKDLNALVCLEARREKDLLAFERVQATKRKRPPRL